MRGIVMLCLIGLLGGGARGEDSAGITVVGYGSVSARPSVVEISAMISGDAELAADAGVKVRDAKQRVADALEGLKTVSVGLESRGLAVTPAIDAAVLAQARMAPQMIVQGGVVMQAQPSMDLSRRTSVVEQVRVVIREADKIEPPRLMETVLKVVDTAKGSGAQFGQANPAALMMLQAVPPVTAPFILYRIPDASRARAQAWQAAIEDARKKAATLAELTGNKVGRILAVHDQDALNRPGFGMTPSATDADGGVSSTVSGEIAVSVRLAVQFEVIR